MTEYLPPVLAKLYYGHTLLLSGSAIFFRGHRLEQVVNAAQPIFDVEYVL